MRFPDLTPKPGEMRAYRQKAAKLKSALERAIIDVFGINAEVTCRGSTEKGTALPGHFFGIDFDMSILGEDEVLNRIALRSDLFEGCQILKLELALALAERFDDIYYAGHRISGTFEGTPFDLSIADPNKDQWKIDFNSSSILDFSSDQLSELRKTKYLMKSMNTYGSMIYGMVGPACELAIANLNSLDRVLEKLRCLEPIKGAPPFSTVPFPTGYRMLFPEPDDHVVKGLIDSFRFTMPNTFNRLIRVANRPTLDPQDYTYNHPISFNYRAPIAGDARFVTFMLNEFLQPEQAQEIELMYEGGLVLYASTDDITAIHDVLHRIADAPTRGVIPGSILPKSTRHWLDEREISIFRGLPEQPTDDNILYIPLDIIIRSDREKLVDLMRKGMNGTH